MNVSVKKWLRLALVLLLCASLSIVPCFADAAGQSGKLQIIFIDVGQADAALVLCDGQSMLIDGGNAADSNTMYSVMKKYGITALDYVIGTHAHEDHIGGIAGALNCATAKTVFCPVTDYDSKAFQNFKKAVEACGTSITVPKTGDSFSLGDASCSILAVNTGSDTNDTSIVLRIVFGSTSFLFAADAERETEQAILARGDDIRSTVLKVGHHGSETSTSYLWLREVDPQYAVISVGKNNSYGCPTDAVLSRLYNADVTLYRTDMQGDITCTSDGSTVSFAVSRNADAHVFSFIGASSVQTETQKKSSSPSASTRPAPTVTQPVGTNYILNTNTKKFHYPSCGSVKQMKESNKQSFTGSRDDVIARGYIPCKKCNP